MKTIGIVHWSVCFEPDTVAQLVPIPAPTDWPAPGVPSQHGLTASLIEFGYRS
ncbi:MAG: hypothetical protein ACREFE_11405 [Limisphaerales bacterium]